QVWQPLPKRELALKVVRHDASAIRQRNGRHPGIGGCGLATAEDRHLVPRAHASQQLADVGPDPAPNPTVLGGRHRDLRCPRSPNLFECAKQRSRSRPQEPGAPERRDSLGPRVSTHRAIDSGSEARKPVRPCSMISRWAAMSETTTGTPAAIASMTAFGEPSQGEG